MSPPLAGKPPFATDQPDSYYESSDKQDTPRRRMAPPKEDPNKRSSAYDMYDSYLTAPNAGGSESPSGRPSSAISTASRNSGIGGIGMGLLNMDDDSDDDSDDEDYDTKRRQQTKVVAPNVGSSGKVATPVNPFDSDDRVNDVGKATPPITVENPFEPSSPPPIAAPRPGYAAPIAALSIPSPAPSMPRPDPAQPFPEPSIPPMAHDPNGGMPQMRMVPAPISPVSYRSGSVAPSLSPTPLQPPMTPIMPVFALPKKEANVSFDDLPKPTPRNPIMRGNTEETLLPRRGEKGDDFWRRFSMVAKVESGKKDSSWLRKTRNGSTRLSRWVWFIAIVILLVIGGAIGLGLYFTRNNPDHQEPTQLGGSTEKAAATFSTSTTQGTSSTSRIMHVTPTHTIAARSLFVRVEDGFVIPEVTETITPAIAEPTGHAIRRHAIARSRLARH